MPTLTLLLDAATGAAQLDDTPAAAALVPLLGHATLAGCARPPTLLVPAPDPPPTPGEPSAHIAGYYHGSLCEGPGRRTSVLFQGCPLRCNGCWVPELHPAAGGLRLGVARLAALLLEDAGLPRDGVSVLGSEPFAQAEALAALVTTLRALGAGHLVVYSGYTLASLEHQAVRRPAIARALTLVDLLIDGPYSPRRGPGGPWTGSANQQILTPMPGVRATSHRKDHRHERADHHRRGS